MSNYDGITETYGKSLLIAKVKKCSVCMTEVVWAYYD